MGTQGNQLNLTLTGPLPGPIKAAFAGSVCLAALCLLAEWTTPIVLRITRFGMLAGLVITAWSGARHMGAWFTETNTR